MNGPTNYADTLRSMRPGCRFSANPETDYGALLIDEGQDAIPSQAEMDAHWRTMKLVAVWQPREFMDRFTLAETRQIIAAKRTNDDLELLWSRAMTGPIHSNSEEFLTGMTALVLAGILTQERADEISDPTR